MTTAKRRKSAAMHMKSLCSVFTRKRNIEFVILLNAGWKLLVDTQLDISKQAAHTPQSQCKEVLQVDVIFVLTL